MQQSPSDDEHESDSSDTNVSLSIASGYSSSDDVIESVGNKEPAIHFAFPQRPPIHTTVNLDRWQTQEVTFWEQFLDTFSTYYTNLTIWIQETKSRLQHERQFTLRSSSIAELPFCIAAFGSIYGTFVLVRAAGKLSQ